MHEFYAYQCSRAIEENIETQHVLNNPFNQPVVMPYSLSDGCKTDLVILLYTSFWSCGNTDHVNPRINAVTHVHRA